MTADDFAERLSQLNGYTENEGGLDRETILSVREDVAQAMREVDEE
jgi:hypothetical protein